MHVNIAGSFINLESDIDYKPKWINTSYRLTDSAASSGTGSGYWSPVIFAIQVLKKPTDNVTIYTLDDNIELRSPQISNYNVLEGGTNAYGKYFYSLSVSKDGVEWAYPSHPIEVNFYGNKKTVKLNWNRVKDADKLMLFKSNVYGELLEKYDLDPNITSIEDDGSLTYSANNIIFGRSTVFPPDAFNVGEVYYMYFRKYVAATKGSDDSGLFMGYRTVNTPLELKLQYFAYGA